MTTPALGALASGRPDSTPAVRPPMRILHVHSGNLWGGVETALLAMATERASCPRLQPEFALCFDGPLRTRLAAAGVVVHELGAVRWRSPIRLHRARRRLHDALRRQPYDGVVIHSVWGHSLFATAVRRTATPLVYWAHDYLDGRHWLQRLARRTPPDLTIANSAFTAGAVHRVFPSSPPVVVHYPLPLQAGHVARAPRAIRARVGTSSHATVIVQVSRLEPWKGHETLLEALGELRSEPSWECWIVGGAQRAQEREYLHGLERRALVGGLGGRVRFLGHRDDVPDLLRAADVFCHPNASPEPFGIALVEALAAGLPVVAAAAGGAREIVVPGCGELVPPRDAPRLAGVLRALIRDPERRRNLGAAGPARAAALCDPSRQLTALADALEHARHT